MHKNIRFLEKWSSVQIITAGFLFIILLGAAILSLPISSQSGQGTNFVDSLFTATSAVCVSQDWSYLIQLHTGVYLERL